MSHISLNNLTITYGDRKVLQDVTVDIPDGRITTIIGPSGCGKTTLLKGLNRLLDLNEDVKVTGKIFIDGVNIYDPNTDVLALRKKVGFLSQRPYPLPMSIYDNIAFGPRVHRMKDAEIGKQLSDLEEQNLLSLTKPSGSGARRKMRGDGLMDLLVESYLNLAGLWDEVKDRLHSPASRLSIGQQQRLALARSLAVEPEVILADEPTSALDPISAQLIEKRFRALKEKYTIVVVTHILRQARRISDYALFLYLGELVEHGPAEQFFNAPKDKRTQAYISGEIS
jgi:phosphate transport system ATP-binding protein